MNSQDMEAVAIQQSYSSTVSNIFDNFVNAYTTPDSPQQQEAAIQDFKAKIKHIRAMKDLAMACIPA